MQMVNKFLRRIKEKHSWFLDLKNSEIIEQKTVNGARTRLQFQMTIRSERPF